MSKQKGWRKRKAYTKEDKKYLLNSFAHFLNFSDDEAITAVAKKIVQETYKLVEEVINELEFGDD